jgi:MGT family glycosyltransferase
MRVQDHPAPPPSPPPRPDWWGGSDAPFVYMTFGTVLGYMSMAGVVYRAALEAVRNLEVRVLLTVGHQLDQRSLGTIPTNVHVEAWIDQSEVLPHADLVVCHGGSGTAFGALAAGVPLVLVPVFADQFENARRIAAAGAGRAVRVAEDSGDGEVIGSEDAPRIAEAIDTVLREPSFGASASRIAAEMAATANVDEVLDVLLGGSAR